MGEHPHIRQNVSPPALEGEIVRFPTFHRIFVAGGSKDHLILDVCYPDYVRVPSICLVEMLELLVLHVAVGSVFLGVSA